MAFARAAILETMDKKWFEDAKRRWDWPLRLFSLEGVVGGREKSDLSFVVSGVDFTHVGRNLEAEERSHAGHVLPRPARYDIRYLLSIVTSLVVTVYA